MLMEGLEEIANPVSICKKGIIIHKSVSKKRGTTWLVGSSEGGGSPYV